MKKYLTKNNVIAFGIFLITLVIYMLSMQRTVPYWDCGEFIASGATMGVPHSPGAPFFTLLGRIFIMLLPFGNNPAIKMNFISVLSSALTIMFLYLIIVSVIKNYKGELKTRNDEIITYGAGIIGSLSYGFSDSFWFNAVEAETYALSLLFLSSVVWLAVTWYSRPIEENNDRYLLLMGYLMGLSIGVHQLSLLCFFLAAWLVYFKLTEIITSKNLLIFMISAPLLFFVIYPGIVQWIPSMIDGTMEEPIKVTDSGLLQIFPIIITLAIGYGIYYTHKHKKRAVNVALMVVLLIMIGYTTYVSIVLRAIDNPPLNMGNPSTAQAFVDFMERKQYGEQPSILKRRTRSEPQYQQKYKNYKSDWDFFWRYQLGHMYFRYFGWNFIGRAGDLQDAPVVLFKDVAGWAKMKGWPQKYYAIPFIIGMLGLFYHIRKDWKTGLAFLSLFIVSGIGLIVFFNVPEPQPRERDYFVVGSFFVFSFWIGFGVVSIVEFIKDYFKKDVITIISLSVLGLIVPINMFIQNYHTHDRSLNYSAWDSGYNMLQSCKKDAILFTGGDNDTYPLWYLQNAEGVRTDIRIVNLSLINIDWYILQQKYDEPFGAKKVPINFSNEEIKSLSDNYISQLPPQPCKLPPVPKEKWSEYGITDSSQISDLTFTMPAYAELRGQKVVRTQDMVIYNIIMNSKWQRPVYFAVTQASSSDKIGLDPFLELQGMTLEVSPIKRSPNRFNFDLKALDEQLLNDSAKSSKEFRHGFMFRNLNNPNLNIEEQAQDIVQTYRALYSMVARELAIKNEREKAKRYIDYMERRMPITILPMAYNLLLDVLDLCMYLNDEEKTRYYSSFAEEEALKMIAKNPKDTENMSVLAMLYERKKEYTKAINIYKKFLEINPNEQNVKARIAYLESLMKTDTTKNKGVN